MHAESLLHSLTHTHHHHPLIHIHTHSFFLSLETFTLFLSFSINQWRFLPPPLLLLFTSAISIPTSPTLIFTMLSPISKLFLLFAFAETLPLVNLSVMATSTSSPLTTVTSLSSILPLSFSILYFL